MITKIGAQLLSKSAAEYNVEEIEPDRSIELRSRRLMRNVLNGYDRSAPGSISAGVRKRTADKVHDNVSKGTTYGVRDGDKIIGFGVTTPSSSGGTSLDYLYVDRNHRGKGVGSAILEHIKSKDGNISLYTDKDRLIRFYKKHGFEPESYYAVKKNDQGSYDRELFASKEDTPSGYVRSATLLKRTAK